MKTKGLFMFLGGATMFAPLLIVASCGNTENKKDIVNTKDVKVASFNISFATDGDNSETYKRWFDFLSIKKDDQDVLVNKIKNGPITDASEKSLAERVVQIRNIATIIQKNRPDVLVLNEFNNDGNGENKEIIKAFQDNYLSIGQSMNSIDGGDLLEPIEYPFFETYATNTGLSSGMDLNNDGKIDNNPQDDYGFGFYHGHYAFGLMSKYEIEKENTRTFQNFKWKDLSGSKIPTIEKDNGKLPAGMKLGDDWFTKEEWDNFRLSSKNHVDVPIKIKVGDKTEKIHLLISHPTPPVFELGGTKTNLNRNMAEVQFWKDYIENNKSLYDDKGVFGGIDGSKEKFVVVGDLNADNLAGESWDKPGGLTSLLENKLVNNDIVTGSLIPTSKGGLNEPNKKKHSKPETRTSVFGLRVDWVIPSKNLDVIGSGVYWSDTDEKGRLLFDDKRIGKYGNSKEVSSDHRLVWTTVQLK